MSGKIQKLLQNEEGAETLEYIVIAAIIIIFGSIAYGDEFGGIVKTAMETLISAANTALGLD